MATETANLFSAVALRPKETVFEQSKNTFNYATKPYEWDFYYTQVGCLIEVIGNEAG